VDYQKNSDIRRNDQLCLMLLQACSVRANGLSVENMERQRNFLGQGNKSTIHSSQIATASSTVPVPPETSRK